MQLGFYCPALALVNGRPWQVHASRVRTIETPGPIIEEIFENDGESADESPGPIIEEICENDGDSADGEPAQESDADWELC